MKRRMGKFFRWKPEKFVPPAKSPEPEMDLNMSPGKLVRKSSLEPREEG